MGALTTAVLTSVPLSTQQTCPGYDSTYGNAFIALHTLFTHVNTKFGAYTAQAYHQARSALLKPFDGGDIDAFLAAQLDAHQACDRSGNPLNPIEQVDTLIASVGKWPAFKFTIAIFEEE